MMIENRSDTVPIWEKMNLTVKEAAGYSNIGESTLREYIRKNPESFEYYGAAEPPVRCGESHLSGLTEPPHFIY